MNQTDDGTKHLVDEEWLSTLPKEQRRHQKKSLPGKVELRGAKKKVDESKIRHFFTMQGGRKVCLSYDILATLCVRSLQTDHRSYADMSKANKKQLEKAAIACKSRRRGREFHDRIKANIEEKDEQLKRYKKKKKDL